jgi:hypothetical protein
MEIGRMFQPLKKYFKNKREVFQFPPDFANGTPSLLPSRFVPSGSWTWEKGE